MSKGDAGKAQNAINTQGGIASSGTAALNAQLLPQDQTAYNNYAAQTPNTLNNYNNIMGGYQSFLNPGTAGSPNNPNSAPQNNFGSEYGGYQSLAGGSGDTSLNGDANGAMTNAISGFNSFAQNGGLSDSDIQNLRARAVSPTRSIYSSAKANVAQQGELNGGFSPNAVASQAQMARDESNQISNADVNANAGIAQMVQQGKLAGNQGLASTGEGLQAAQQGVNTLNSQNRLAGLSGQAGIDQATNALNEQGREFNTNATLNGMQGMTSLYGTNPALLNSFGTQLTNSNSGLQTGQQMQNNLGLGLINAQINKSSIPSDFSQAMGNISSVANLGAGVAGSFMGLGSGTPPGLQTPMISPQQAFSPLPTYQLPS